MATDLEQQQSEAPAAAATEASTPLVEIDLAPPPSAAEQVPELVDGAVAEVEESAAAEEVDISAMEALLFSTPSPLTPARLADLLGLGSTKPVRKAVADLNRLYEQSGRSFRAEQIAGGYQLLTLPVHGPLLQKLHQREIDSKLTSAALETLAVVAYKQPIVRADIEAIRGVACGETLRSLMEKHLVKVAGRADVPGRPILYGTTKRFLDVFGLNSLKDLPKDEQLPAPAAAVSPEVPVADAPSTEPA